jgi:hypothetical protein
MEAHRRENLVVNDFHGLRGGGGKRSKGSSVGGFSRQGMARLQKEQERNSPLVAWDAVYKKKSEHTAAVRDALLNGSLSDADFDRLHAHTYDKATVLSHRTREEQNAAVVAERIRREQGRAAAKEKDLATPKPRQPTLAQIHKEQGVAPDRARKEREIWAATHKDYKGYSPERGHTVMYDGGSHQIRAVSDEMLDKIHSFRVKPEAAKGLHVVVRLPGGGR